MQKWKTFDKYYEDSAITQDEIIDAETKTISTNFNEKNVTLKTQIFHVLVVFLLVTLVLLIAVSIYCDLIIHTKILLFTTLDMWWSKIRNT